MGMVIEGQWSETDLFMEKGRFTREKSVINRPFKIDAESTMDGRSRYWLIASASCPWSHRVTIMRHLRGAGQAISLHIAHGPRQEGYSINGGEEWDVPGTGEAIVHLHQLYTMASPGYTGRATVPVLWDSQLCRILSNDSAQIMRTLNAMSVGCKRPEPDYYPRSLRAQIDAVNERIYTRLANAVYRAGFAIEQAPYEEAVRDVFNTLDWLEGRLSGARFLMGAVLTEADWRLFPTLVRFDAVYHVLHRCCRRRLTDYAALWAYARDLYAWRGICETVDFDEIRHASYTNDTAHNPHRIVATPPDVDWDAPHDRDSLGTPLAVMRDGSRAAFNPATGEVL